MTDSEMKQLEYAIAEITEIAEGFGLDFYPMRYEVCPADIIYTFGAYGMPTRFAHWSFGKAFQKMKLQYDLGLSKIYELVINSNPCYAFLLDGNSLVQNKLIVAHVLAHCDFFKNNIRFMNTSRDMVESMSASATRIREYEMEYGRAEVERFLDAVLSIQEHIDPSILRPKRRQTDTNAQSNVAQKRPKSKRSDSTYEDLWLLDELDDAEGMKKNDSQDQTNGKKKRKRFPPEPEKDVMLFIEEHSTELDAWQRDIMTILREEMRYFWPQMETKIMNEGWASYWHVRIMRELELNEEETVEFARLNASVVAPSTTSINPYYLGFKMFENIEERWDDPTEEEQQKFGRKPGQGREKIFEVRELDADISFLRNYLTKDLVEELDLYLFQKQGDAYKIVDKNWESVRDELVSMRVNGGHPYITVEDGDFQRTGQLLLKHYYEGTELDVKYIEKTLPHVYHLWGKPVHLETIVDEKPVRFSYGGDKVERRFVR